PCVAVVGLTVTCAKAGVPKPNTATAATASTTPILVIPARTAPRFAARTRRIGCSSSEVDACWSPGPWVEFPQAAANDRGLCRLVGVQPAGKALDRQDVRP